MAQLNDDFSDGDLYSNPVWKGNTGKFETDSFQKLHLKAEAVTSQAYLSTPSEAVVDGVWQFYCEISKSTSSSNLAKVFLISDQESLDGPLNGYFVKIGGTKDEISLYRQDGSEEAIIIDGLDKRIESTPVQVYVKVSRDPLGNWQLESKLEEETSYYKEGSAFDNTHTTSKYFGLYCKYTSTRSTAYYFDNIVVNGSPLADQTAPKVISQTILSYNQLAIGFNKALHKTSAENFAHYLVADNDISEIRYHNDTVIISFVNAFKNASAFTLKIRGIEDEHNNTLADTTLEFYYFEETAAYWNTILINEFLPDPTPALSDLPDASDAEFIELYNPGPHPHNLLGWTIDGKALPEYILPAGAYLIVCPVKYDSTFANYGPSLGINSWPSLSNSGASLVLKDKNALLIDSLTYDAEDYLEGISLERVFTKAPCSINFNYKACSDKNGATPAAINSVHSTENDLEAPQLTGIRVPKADSIEVSFSEKVYLNIPYTDRIAINDTLSPLKVVYLDRDSSHIAIILQDDLPSEQIYKLYFEEVYDCNGNLDTDIRSSFYLDLEPPGLLGFELLDTAQIKLQFSEKLLKPEAERESNFIFRHPDNLVKKAVLSEDSLSVILNFTSALSPSDRSPLLFTGLEDLHDNRIADTLSINLTYFTDIAHVKPLNAHVLEVSLKQQASFVSLMNKENYTLDRSIGHPNKIIYEEETNIIRLLFEEALDANKDHELSIGSLFNKQSKPLTTPIYRFFFDTKSPEIDSLNIIDNFKLSFTFDEALDTSYTNEVKLFINQELTNFQDLIIDSNQLQIRIPEGLAQEKWYYFAFEGLSDSSGNFSKPNKEYKFYYDQQAPRLDSAYVFSHSKIMLIFNEAIMPEDIGVNHFIQKLKGIRTQSIKFYLLEPNHVLISSTETINLDTISFELSNFADHNYNQITKPINVKIIHQRATIGHISPLSEYEMLLNFTSDISLFDLKNENFLLNDETPESVNLIDPYSIKLLFTHPFRESIHYNLQYSYQEHTQTLKFEYQDYIDNLTLNLAGIVDIKLTTKLNSSTAEDVTNFFIPSIGHPEAALYIKEQNSIQLFFTSGFKADSLYRLEVKHLSNVDSTTLPSSIHLIGKAHTPTTHALLFTEIMAKPSAATPLPVAEYIEVYNASNQILQLSQIRLADAQKTVSLPNYWLAAGEYLTLCATTDLESLSKFGKCLGITSFPNLNDDADILQLINENDEVIHSVAYDDSWYNNATKNTGGWSLEMIDKGLPCQEKINWRASDHPNGGTPSSVNSVTESRPDNVAPTLLETLADDSLHITIVFSEKLDQNVLNEISIVLDDIPLNLMLLSLEGYKIKAELEEPLKVGKTSALYIDHLKDCSGNVQFNRQFAEVILPEAHSDDDVLISEILFHPRSGGVDFIELYNNSNKHINLKQWKLKNQDGNTSLLSQQTLIIKPSTYIALTPDVDHLMADYPKATEKNCIALESFPNLLSEGGQITLLDQRNCIMQQVDYTPDWHHPLIQETRGVSLERLNWESDENDHNNWQSAASSVGYATPTAPNSQRMSTHERLLAHALQVEPQIFYPDQSGFRDFASIRYQIAGNGNIANLKIFSARGQLVRSLAKNISIAEEGFFNWDGTDDHQKRVKNGYYIVWLEVFNPKGNVSIFRSKVAVGSKY
ncbi:lamin tail domain-containing protein [Porifericola rhodea]|uniref:lamin tail domain-containing protein n=1 Tax=Porifericola rhodea TaxID=930972 RepID=UPI0026667507|nr:lamin tail domain-containing protein [Porifericola rhodea]WKN30534.1 lamin tail domain-containing protein [Porifericola rhodea]